MQFRTISLQYVFIQSLLQLKSFIQTFPQLSRHMPLSHGIVNGYIYLQSLLPVFAYLSFYTTLFWFDKISIYRRIIVSFYHLRFEHNCLPTYSYYLSFHDFPFCASHDSSIICDFSHLLSHCPTLAHKRLLITN